MLLPQPTATGPLAKLICIMSESIKWLSNIDPTNRKAAKKGLKGKKQK
jgi:hypothetical protein